MPILELLKATHHRTLEGWMLHHGLDIVCLQEAKVAWEVVREQLERVSHVSFLGQTHPAAIELAGRLCGFFPRGTLDRVFFSDNGSTAVECALKMSLQYRQQTGDGER
jgi:adenosylmethionine-8-amino-7-oxononanoate aminotransferase